jgi:hypothetical protein
MQCWYCELRDSDKNCGHNFDMFGEVDVKKNDSLTNVSYSVMQIEIPRCHDCYNRHKIALFSLYAVIPFALIIIAAVIALALEALTPLMGGIFAGLAAGLIIAALLSNKLIQKGIHTVKFSRAEYPTAKDLLARGWRCGVRPREALPDSDPPPAPEEENGKRDKKKQVNGKE